MEVSMTFALPRGVDRTVITPIREDSMTDCVLAIDQGTTGTTALLLDENVEVVASANVEFPNHYPQPGMGWLKVLLFQKF